MIKMKQLWSSHLFIDIFIFFYLMLAKKKMHQYKVQQYKAS